MDFERSHFTEVSHDFVGNLTILLKEISRQNLSVMKPGQIFVYGFKQCVVESSRLKVSGKQRSRVHPSPIVHAAFIRMDDNATMDFCFQQHIHKFWSFSIGILIFCHDDRIVGQVPGSFHSAFE